MKAETICILWERHEKLQKRRLRQALSKAGAEQEATRKRIEEIRIRCVAKLNSDNHPHE